MIGLGKKKDEMLSKLKTRGHDGVLFPYSIKGLNDGRMSIGREDCR
ncbi:MAG: hypothetical protein RL585_15 [Pseudomonadota bacterium]